MINPRLKQTGFTIVELLVVIVVIGILAAISIISYTGVSQKASIATLKSDLSSASTRLGLDNVNDGNYPASVAAANGGHGLQKSPGTTYSYNLVSGGYCLSATSTAAGTSYHITTGGAVESGTCASTWAQIVGGNGHTCAIASDNQAYCWGQNTYGQLGNNSTTQSNVPVAVTNTGALSGKTIKSIAAGDMHTCAIASDDQAYCWGYNYRGELGNNSTTQSNVPVAVDTSGVLNGKTIQSISAGSYYTCVIASDNQVYCWGYNSTGNLGNNSIIQSNIPVAVVNTGALSGKTVKYLSVGYSHVCVIASDNQSYCWGLGNSGQLGNNSLGNSSVPVVVNTAGVLSGKTIKTISSGNSHTCSIASDDQAYCWGYDYYGQLGNNSTTNSSVPVAVVTTGALSGKTILYITSDAAHTCAIASDNQAYCWGYNTYGQLGNNSTSQSNVPVAVSTTGVLSGKTVVAIASGFYHTCVITSEHQIYSWGLNNYGQFGNNSTTDSLIPTATQPPPQ